MKQIGLALQNYHESHRMFPPFIVSRSGNPQRVADPDKVNNWLISLLPQMDQNSIYTDWNFDLPINQNPGRSIKLPALMCPSDPGNSGSPCAYAGGGWARGNYGMNVSPCSHSSDSTTSGALSGLGGIGGPNFCVRIGHVADGTSNTVAVDELRIGLNEQDLRGSWAMPGLGSGTAALFNDASKPNDPGGNSDDMENCLATGLAGDGSRRMGCFDSSTTAQMAPRSAHKDGVHALLLDGSVRFISNNIDSRAGSNNCGPQDNRGIWQAIHTRSANEVEAQF